MSNTIQVKGSRKTMDLAYMALGAVLIAVCSWISIPTAVPFTMQTFGIFFVLLVLGGKRGAGTVLVYVLLGMVGVPVFAQFTSGVGVLLGTTGGYVVGFVLTGLIYWFITELFGKNMWIQVFALILGTAVLYAFGTAWFLVVYARTSGSIGVGTALAWCVIPFIVPDLIKMGLAFMLAGRIKPALRFL